MSASMHCRPCAYQCFARQMLTIDRADAAGLLDAAMAVAMHELGEIDRAAVHHQLQQLAETVRSRVPHQVQQLLANDPINPEPVLAHLHQVLFDEFQLTGNMNDYYNPRNSYVPSVLDTRRGIPVTLTLIYKYVAERVGLHVHGINAPGHFLAGIDLPACACAATTDESCDQRMYIDSFNAGRVLRREELSDLLEQTLGRSIVLHKGALSPASNRQWLHRLLQNLQNIFAFNRREQDLAAMQEMVRLLHRPA